MKKSVFFGIALVVICVCIYKLGDASRNLSRNQSTSNTRVVDSKPDSALESPKTASDQSGLQEEPSHKGPSRKPLEPLQLITTDPAEAESKLADYAKTLNDEDIVNLKNNALNSKLSGDERLISIELIMRSNTSNHNSELLQIANATLIDHQNPTRNSEELAFRARAIEGITAISTLKEIADRNSNRFLSDRANRAIAYLNGSAPSLKDQDEAALKKLIK